MRNRRLTRRDERGATLVIVAAFIIVAVILTAAVVDLGNLRAERKEVTLSTDAAALAAVEAIDFTDPNAKGNGTDCASVRSVDDPTHYPTVWDVAERYMVENGESVLEACKIFFGTPGANQMYLTVSGSDDVQYAFGPAIGQAGGSTSGISSARAGSASLDGVLPIGVCGPDNPGVETFVNPGYPFPQYFGGSESVTLDFGNSNCSASGNHDQIDFVPHFPPGMCDPAVEGAFCSDVVSYGFEGFIDPIVHSNPGGGGWNGQGLEPPLEDLRDRKVHVFVPVIGRCTEVPPPDTECSGATAAYPVKYLMEVVIDTFVANGPGAGFTFDVYQVVDYAYYQANGLPPSTVDLAVQTHICATSADASPCTNNPVSALPPPPPPPPPPAPACQVMDLKIRRFADPVTAGSSSLALPWGTGNKLSEKVALDFTVADFGDCANLEIELGDNPLGPVSPTSNSFTVAVEAGETQYQKTNTYPVGASAGAATVAVPATSLSIGG